MKFKKVESFPQFCFYKQIKTASKFHFDFILALDLETIFWLLNKKIKAEFKALTNVQKNNFPKPFWTQNIKFLFN